MNVSPIGSGNITSPDFSSQPTTYPTDFTCANNYLLTPVANEAAGYKFDRWGGDYTDNTKPLAVDVSLGPKSVTAYFILSYESLNLSEAVDTLNSTKDMIVLDVSSVSDFNTCHMLCAKNYPWNTATNRFDGGIASLNSYKTEIFLFMTVMEQRAGLPQSIWQDRDFPTYFT